MAVVTLVQFLQMAVLARFLSPRDFGLMAVTMIVVNFAQIFTDMGTSKAIIQKQELNHVQLSSLYWLNVASGFLMTIIVSALSPFIASFFEEASIKPLIMQLSLIFLIIAAGNQYRVLCQKELEFKRMAAIEMSAAILSLCVAGALASNGYGIRSLVYAVLTQATLSSFLFLTYGLKHHHRPAFVYRHREVRPFFAFGFYQMGENAVNYISANMDKILIGKILGMQAAGFYNLAWQLIIFPVTKINPVVNKVAYPVYARLQGDSAQTQTYYETSMKALSLVTIPALVGLCVFAEDVVRVFYGEGWDETATLVRILCAAGIVKAVLNPAGALILARGRADIGFWWNVLWAVSLSAALYITIVYSG
ncbi:MAG: colanic acid exporter, partial [Micavibrio aeruginosavorus]